MTDEISRVKFAIDTVRPIISEASELFSRLVSGAMSLAIGKAQLRNILASAAVRLGAAEADDRARDAAHDARVKRCGFGDACVLPPGHAGEHSDEITKP